MRDRKYVKKRNLFIKSVLFCGIFIFLFIGVNYLMKPVWNTWVNYDKTRGFYKEPEDTIETLFLGSSHMICGISPMELYEQYGISSYNMGTEQQPMMASYYWLEEAYKYQGNSMKNVVLDMSLISHQAQDAYYIKSLVPMRLSSTKYRFASDFSKGDWNDTLNYLIPLLQFHSRWSELDYTDFQKITYEPKMYVRGYGERFFRSINLGPVENLPVPEYLVDQKADGATIYPEAKIYFEKIVNFCKEHDLKLTMIKTPAVGMWRSNKHNVVQKLADQYNLEFYDFNFTPYIDDINYNHSMDNADNSHLNYAGAMKLTKWIGEYLVSECGARDVRDEKEYAFLEEELADYTSKVKESYLFETEDDLIKYIDRAMKKSGLSIYITVKGDAASALTEEQRAYFKKIGLDKLSAIEPGDAYLAVINDGKLEAERMKRSDEMKDPDDPLKYVGRMKNNDMFILKSSSSNASCIVNEEECALNLDGINLVLYDTQENNLYTQARFETGKVSYRVVNMEYDLTQALEKKDGAYPLTGKLWEAYIYQRMCFMSRLNHTIALEYGDSGLLYCLKEVMNQSRYEIFLSVKEDAAGAFDDATRKWLRDAGLEKLSTITEGDSYLAVIDNGKVKQEIADDIVDEDDVVVYYDEEEDEYYEVPKEVEKSTKPLSLKEFHLTIKSGGKIAGKTSSIKVEGEEYSLNKKGINLVVYDKDAKKVVSRQCFNTNKTTPLVPEND